MECYLGVNLGTLGTKNTPRHCRKINPSIKIKSTKDNQVVAIDRRKKTAERE
jgi:hypothetical protein